MLYEAFTENVEEDIAQVTNKLLLTLAIATSLDAMAAGYSLHLFSVNVYLSIFILWSFVNHNNSFLILDIKDTITQK